jgi:hypothetical protein
MSVVQAGRHYGDGNGSDGRGPMHSAKASMKYYPRMVAEVVSLAASDDEDDVAVNEII